MSNNNLFKKNHYNCVGGKTYINNKTNRRDIFNTPVVNENLKKPIPLIKKSINNRIKKEELPEKKQDKEPVILSSEKRDLSKKAKTTPNHSKTSRRIQTEIKINKISKKDEFIKKIETKLKENSFTKNELSHKKVKNNDFLKCSINLNIEPEFDTQNNEENNKGNSDINAILLDSNNNTKKENSNEITNIKTISINKNNNLKNNNDYRNNEIFKEKEKDIKKENQRKIGSNKNISKSHNLRVEMPKRSLTNKNIIKSYSHFKIEKIRNSIDKKYTMKNPAMKTSLYIKSSIKESIKKNNNIKKSININNIIIPLLNRVKENNCFLNVIIQVLFHSTEFKKELLENNYNLSRHSRTINELFNLLKSYSSEQVKNKDNKNPIEPVISVNELRNYLNEKYKCYRAGEAGDPMETLGYIFDLIHMVHCRKMGLNYKTIENCKCPIHQYFFLKLVDIISCPFCKARKIQMFNKDCYMFNIFIKDLTNKLNRKSFNSYKLQLFSKLKELNETYENENKIKIPGCNCNLKLISSYEKKLKLIGPSSTYLIINITWAEEFPSMMEILTAYGLIPISESINNLFTFGEDIKTKINEIYYIKSIILYGIYHYICILYIKDQKRWAVVDDKTIKYINKYFDLIDFLLRNHLMPVGLIYSKDRNDEIDENEIKSYSLTKDEFIKLYQFCKDVDIRRGLKVSDLIISKGSFNENNENYLNNNIFYNSIIDLTSSNNNNNNKLNIINNNFNPKTETNKKKFINKERNRNEKNNNLFNKDNNIEIPENNYKTEILKNRKVLGNFSDQNMKGGIIILSSSLNDNKENNEKSKAKEESDLHCFGQNYV